MLWAIDVLYNDIAPELLPHENVYPILNVGKPKLTASYDSTTIFLSDSVNLSCMVSLKRLLLSN